MPPSDASSKTKKDKRRRALTSLPLPVLDEESSCLGMEFEESESYHDLPTPINELYMSPHPNLKSKSRLNTTCGTTNFSLVSLAESKQREEFHDDLYFRNTMQRSRKHQHPLDLSRHEISDKLRGKMMDWMIEVFNIYKQKEETLFRAFALLDRYLHKSPRRLCNHELHLIGSSCMMIASKSEEVSPLRLPVILEEICKNKFSKSTLLAHELEVLSVVDFQTSTPTVFDLILCALRLLDVGEGEIRKFIVNVSLLISKMCLFSLPLLNRCDMNVIAASAVCLALKLVENLQTDFESDSHVS